MDIQHVRPDKGLTGQRMSDSIATFSGSWGALYGVLRATFKSLLGVERHSLAWGALFAVLQNLNFTTLLIYLFPEQKIYVRAPAFQPSA